MALGLIGFDLGRGFPAGLSPEFILTPAKRRNIPCPTALAGMTDHPFRHWLTKLGAWSAHPGAFAIVGAYAILWFIFERDSLNWHGVATLATWTMTLFIQRAEHRDTQALQAKLDELLRVHGEARNELTRLDDQEPEEIEHHREEARRGE
jgi:low affinity Fe/Cu permease